MSLNSTTINAPTRASTARLPTTIPTTLTSATVYVEPTTTIRVPSPPSPSPEPLQKRSPPYAVITIAVVVLILCFIYLLYKWRQKGKIPYIIPRVFVLCSPRTVQYHYELILRVGLPSNDFNPDKHDVDITVLGQQRNEVVPITRLNTKTLYDEPLITCLSIIVYRLVELPVLSSLLLRHSGTHRSWIFAYDFTIIDLNTNKEQFYTLNQYISGLDRLMQLQEPIVGQVHYPIDDVPLPKWNLEDIILVLYSTINLIFVSITLMPISCNYTSDIFSILITSFGAMSLLNFLEWLFYYNLRWNADRKEYFNDYSVFRFMPSEYVCSITMFLVSTFMGITAIYYALSIRHQSEFYIWLLCVTNTCTIVAGLWNAFKQANFAETVIGLGLRLYGVENVSIGMRDSDFVSSSITQKYGSTSDDGSAITTSGHNSSMLGNNGAISRVAMNIGPRSSVKSFGFDLIREHISRNDTPTSSKVGPHGSRASSTGATPNNQPSSRIIRRKASGFGSTLHHGSSVHQTSGTSSKQSGSESNVSKAIHSQQTLSHSAASQASTRSGDRSRSLRSNR